MAGGETATCGYEDWTGAFLLGALERGEREEFVAHLDACSRCDHEVATLLPVVFWLDAHRPGRPTPGPAGS